MRKTMSLAGLTGRFFLAIVFSLTALLVPNLAVAKKPTCPGPHPSCSDDPPDIEDPVGTQPAFAYYCKKNPNEGAVCLANADGTQPVKIFKTSKFLGDQFQISAYQSDDSGSGGVLVIDSLNLYQIEYSLDENGYFSGIDAALQLTFNDISEQVYTAEWNPSGSDFVFAGAGKIYLGSRADFSSANWGAEIVVDSRWGDSQYITALSWGPDGNFLYFVSHVTERISEGDMDYSWQLRRAYVGSVIVNGGTIYESDCLFASNDPIGDCASVTDTGLFQLKDLSVSEDGEVFVSASGYPSASGFATLLVGDEPAIIIPDFRGQDWTPDNTILGESGDDVLVELAPPNGPSNVVIGKNATSPDWVN